VRKKGRKGDRPADLYTRNLPKRAEMGNKPGTEAITRVPQSLPLRNEARCVPGTWGGTYNVLPGSAQGLRKWNGKLDSRAAKKGVKTSN
jgi:hypothetical protein